MSKDRAPLVRFIQGILPIDGAIAESIAGHFKPLRLARGELFLREGIVSDQYLYLETGFLRSFLHDTEGDEVTINFNGSNSVVFEVASFFQRTPTVENIQALTDSVGWVLSYDELNNLFHTIYQFREFGRAVLVRGFIAYKQRTLSMINKTAEARYEELLRSNPEVFQYAPLKYIASYLGITDTSLSRIRKEFSQR